MLNTLNQLSAEPISRRDFLRRSIKAITDPHAAAINAILRSSNVPLRPVVLHTKAPGQCVEIQLDRPTDPRYIDEDGEVTDTYHHEVSDAIYQALDVIFGERNEWGMSITYRS